MLGLASKNIKGKSQILIMLINKKSNGDKNLTEIHVGIISLAIGMLIILILSLIPLESILIDQLDSSITISSDSQWNSSNNPNIMSGRSFWNLISNIMYPFGVICIIFGFYKTLKDIRE